ncbi:MAG: hypothetical protein Q9164_000427 [Protoblastenia rupestris]
MGKSKRQKPQKSSSKLYSKRIKTKTCLNTSTKKEKAAPPQRPPTIPFEPTSRILLIGEGDFSFARSLLDSHLCTLLHSTSFDTRSGVLSKYPQAAAHTKALEAEEGCKVEYGVDATKLGRLGGGGKAIRRGNWAKVVFNFPHVGGLTKDVNRQVRANQELLVGFFKSAKNLLSHDGQIVVTIFEGEPYDLWNVRDLARHAGLKVERSFRFQASAYPGYKHARTLGIIEGGGGWKGEDRPARTYVFEVNDGQQLQAQHKRKRERSDSESD